MSETFFLLFKQQFDVTKKIKGWFLDSNEPLKFKQLTRAQKVGQIWPKKTSSSSSRKSFCVTGIPLLSYGGFVANSTFIGCSTLLHPIYLIELQMRALRTSNAIHVSSQFLGVVSKSELESNQPNIPAIVVIYLLAHGVDGGKHKLWHTPPPSPQLKIFRSL